MPIISTFFGIVIRLYYDEHNPPHIHVEYQGEKAVLDFRGNVTRGGLSSRTTLRLVREWIDRYHEELLEDWRLAREGRELKKIKPLD